MRSKRLISGFVVFLFFGVVMATKAMADDGMAYKWTALYDTEGYTNTIGITLATTDPSYSVGLYTLINPTEITPLFSTTDDAGSYYTFGVEIDQISGFYKIITTATSKTSGLSDIVLGESLEFGFVFYAGDELINKYVLESNADGYKLTGQSTTITVKGTGIASVSAVPIPGSALLLGSSLLGLVGISTRKKKA